MDPVTGGAAIAAWLESMAAGAAVAEGTAAAVAPAVIGGAEGALGAAEMALLGESAAGPLAANGLMPGLGPMSLIDNPAPQYAALNAGPFTPTDKMGSMLDKYGPKLAGQMGAQMMGDDPQPMPQAGGPRMNGQQQQAQPVTMDYGGAAQRKPPGGAALLGIDDEELKRLLMSLRGY